MAKFKPFKFISDAYSELKHVVWPTRPEVVRKTILIVVVILIGGAIIGALDFGLALGIKNLISLR